MLKYEEIYKFANNQQCPYCNGVGEKIENRKITVTIPKGIKEGAKLRLKGEGQEGQFGGSNGNLYIIVNIEKNEELKIKDGITEYILNTIHNLFDINKYKIDILSVCFPSSEISLEAYWNFIGEDPDSDYDENKFDEFDVQGYKNRILFLQYLIDKI